jgi:hypothetical protein
MADEDERPAVIPSPIDPDVECVRIDTQTPSGDVAGPPSPPAAAGEGTPKLCPDGYVPRRRQRADYTLEGKRVVGKGPPIRNPDEPAH